jgi:hypothetical protein
MNWTNEPPERPGFYWWRKSIEEGSAVVWTYGDSTFLMNKVSFHGSLIDVDEFGGQWWPERIPEPPQ